MTRSPNADEAPTAGRAEQWTRQPDRRYTRRVEFADRRARPWLLAPLAVLEQQAALLNSDLAVTAQVAGWL
ncbi:MAG TPA: hypothetical protein VGD09_10290, partial [Blastococcus sp.]